EELEIENASGDSIDRVAFAPEGDWAIRRIGAADQFNRQGWEWFAEHDGLGKSLELINSALPNEYGQNWAASLEPGGTPGSPNSVRSSDTAPFILSVGHRPIVPRTTDTVTVTARIIDEIMTGVEVRVHWRMDGAPGFTTGLLFD